MNKKSSRLITVLRVIEILIMTVLLGLTPYVLGKTIWDLLELLVIPAVLAVGAYWLNKQERDAERKLTDQRTQTEHKIASDRLQEAALQTYFDQMTDLMIEKGLRTSATDAQVRLVARARTLTVLRRLDGIRKGIVLRFLDEAGLIKKDGAIVLRRADLGGAILSGDLPEADLSAADLSGTNLSEADLSWTLLDLLTEANLSKANLHGAYLCGADLSRTNLTGADLSGAHMTGAKISNEELASAKSLKGTILPDGTVHD